MVKLFNFYRICNRFYKGFYSVLTCKYSKRVTILKGLFKIIENTHTDTHTNLSKSVENRLERCVIFLPKIKSKKKKRK